MCLDDKNNHRKIRMSIERKLKVGILGCGPIAQFAHLEAVRKAANASLFAVCDADTYLADKMGTFYEATRIYYEYDQMLSDPDVDLVIIATSDSFHLEASKKAILAGKHVLVEKPLGSNLQEAIALQTLISNSGLKLQVGHMKRFDPNIQYARDFIQQRLGGLLAYKGWYCDSAFRYDMTDSTQPKPFAAVNPLKPEQDEKAHLEKYYMMAHGSHLIDTAQFLAGPIASVTARLRKKQKIHVWFVDTEFTSGCMGHLHLQVVVQMDWSEGFEVHGEQGDVMGKIYNPWYFKSSEVRCFASGEETYKEPLNHKAHFFQNQLESFSSSILQNTPPIGATISDGIAVLKVMLAIKESIALGQQVHLDQLQFNEL